MAGREPAALVLGSVHMDLIGEAERIPGPGESVGGGSFAMAPGGKAANQAAQLALCGLRVAVVARLGGDAFAAALVEALAAKGVDVSSVVSDPAGSTGASTVLSARGEYASIIAPGAGAAWEAAEIERLAGPIAEADALVLQMEIPASVSLAAARRAAEAGVAVALNPSPLPASPSDEARALVGAADVLVLNRAEALGLFGSANPAAIASAAGAACVVVTKGWEGAAGWRDGEAASVPAFPVEPVDVVGAGDAFLGAFLAAHLRGAPLGRCLEMGAAAGALCARGRGALASFHAQEAIEKLASGCDGQTGAAC